MKDKVEICQATYQREKAERCGKAQQVQITITSYVWLEKRVKEGYGKTALERYIEVRA